jgi:hypothetical protein
MKALTGTLLALFLCVQASCTSAQAATPSANGVRFGWISRYNRGMQPEPIVDRYVGNIRAGIARAAGVTTVNLPGTPLQPDDYTRFCKSLHLRGFIESAVGFRNDALEVSAGGTAIVTDCDGQVFFAENGFKLEPRKSDEPAVTQLDAAEASAALALQQQFLAYRDTHESEWASMLAKGWIPANPAPAELEMARLTFALKNYGATLTMCSTLDPKVRAELLKARVVFGILHPATTDRLFVLGRIEDIINLDYLRAAANQKLGNPDLIQQPALEGAEWVLLLDRYVHREYTDQRTRPFTYLEGRITEMRAQYGALSSGIFAEAAGALSRPG